jgi:acetyl-CoA acyltransferase
MTEVVVVSAVRTPIGRAGKGNLRLIRPDDMAALAVKEALSRAQGITAEEIEDLTLGCATPEQEQGMNLGRIVALRAGLPVTTSACTVNRFCASGLEAIASAANRILSGQNDIVMAGGVESMSCLPFEKMSINPNPWLVKEIPDTYSNMGLTAENLAEKFDISRERSDEFAYQSHMKACAAIEAGRFKEEILPVAVQFQDFDERGKLKTTDILVDTDEGPRKDTTLKALAGLKPVFKKDGTVTAGNSSQRSDGAAAVVLMRADMAKERGITPIAKFIGYATAGCDPGIMGIGPAFAIPKLLKRTGYKLADISVIELNEAFACQALAVIQETGLDASRVNPNGGGVALGHPLGCTGSRQLATLVSELKRRGGGIGMISMCIGGGMGAAGLFEV